MEQLSNNEQLKVLTKDYPLLNEVLETDKVASLLGAEFLSEREKDSMVLLLSKQERKILDIPHYTELAIQPFSSPEYAVLVTTQEECSFRVGLIVSAVVAHKQFIENYGNNFFDDVVTLIDTDQGKQHLNQHAINSSRFGMYQNSDISRRKTVVNPTELLARKIHLMRLGQRYLNADNIFIGEDSFVPTQFIQFKLQLDRREQAHDDFQYRGASNKLAQFDLFSMLYDKMLHTFGEYDTHDTNVVINKIISLRADELRARTDVDFERFEDKMEKGLSDFEQGLYYDVAEIQVLAEAILHRYAGRSHGQLMRILSELSRLDILESVLGEEPNLQVDIQTTMEIIMQLAKEKLGPMAKLAEADQLEARYDVSFALDFHSYNNHELPADTFLIEKMFGAFDLLGDGMEVFDDFDLHFDSRDQITETELITFLQEALDQGKYDIGGVNHFLESIGSDIRFDLE